jgi:hypothetical protein
VDRWGVFDDDHELALRTLKAEVGDRCGAVREQTLLVRRVGPCPGHHLRAVHRAEVVLEVLDDLVEDVGVEDALLTSTDSIAATRASIGASLAGW